MLPVLLLAVMIFCITLITGIQFIVVTPIITGTTVAFSFHFFSWFSFSPWYFLRFLCSLSFMLLSLGIGIFITTDHHNVCLVSHQNFISLDLEIPKDLSLELLNQLFTLGLPVHTWSRCWLLLPSWPFPIRLNPVYTFPSSHSRFSLWTKYQAWVEQWISSCPTTKPPSQTRYHFSPLCNEQISSKNKYILKSLNIQMTIEETEKRGK